MDGITDFKHEQQLQKLRNFVADSNRTLFDHAKHILQSYFPYRANGSTSRIHFYVYYHAIAN